MLTYVVKVEGNLDSLNIYVHKSLFNACPKTYTERNEWFYTHVDYI